MVEDLTFRRPLASTPDHCNKTAKRRTKDAMAAPRPTIKGQEVGGGPIPGNPHSFPRIVRIFLPLLRV